MKLSDFDYPLPEELIAQAPLAERDASRMLVLDRKTGTVSHSAFRELAGFLRPGDLLVFNESRVVKARLEGKRASGGVVECFVLGDRGEGVHECLLRSSAKKDGLEFTLADGARARVAGKSEQDGAFLVKFEFASPGAMTGLMHALGHVPLPPYIQRSDDAADVERYQCVYAKAEGSVAAPTAGLHFTRDSLAAVEKTGARVAFVSLHVGMGTFQPVKADDIDDHRMHRESFRIGAATLTAIRETKERGGRVIAVGTTSARTLESWARGMGEADAEGGFAGATDLFLKPGSEFLAVDALLTNFHLPKSTLVIMLAAFAGLASVKHAYAEAVQGRYRFFSYGDCMLVL